MRAGSVCFAARENIMKSDRDETNQTDADGSPSRFPLDFVAS